MSSLFAYVGSPNPNLICCICRMPFTDPTTTTTCAHTFCMECIVCALEHTPQCPIDRSALAEEQLVPADPIIRSLVDELVVECTHRVEGCTYTCQRQSLAAHLRDHCPYREDADAADSSMPVYKDASTSTEDIVDTFEPGTDESTSSDHRRLLEHNILLRKRVETLETSLEIFKREMIAVKKALGPWFRAGEVSTRYYGIDRQANMMPPIIDREGIQDTITSIPSSSMTASALAEGSLSGLQRPLSISGGADSLAAYFPPETEGFYAGLQGQQQNAGSRYYPHGLVPTIAPLNLSTTVEGALHGLRESVVGLAAAVDSMGRRHEIALTNETMRMGEEVGGLRAGIHGLRMQVHAIMMERNAQVTGRDGVGEGPPGRMYYGQPAPSFTKL